MDKLEFAARAFCFGGGCPYRVLDRPCAGPGACRAWRDDIEAIGAAIAACEAWDGEQRLKAHEATFDPRHAVEMFGRDREDDVDEAAAR